MQRIFLLIVLTVTACGREPADTSSGAAGETTAGTTAGVREPAETRQEPAPGLPASVPAEPPALGGDPRGHAYGFDVGEVRAARDYLAEPKFSGADFERGELLSLACRACHTMAAGQQHNIGPNLYGIFGRQAAQAPGFVYSEALANSGLVWTPKALEAWLVAPAEFIVGNNMTFAGYRSATDRRD